MPVYNGSSTVARTLESLLEQTAKFDELIIINDASSDNSENLIRNFLDGKIEYRLAVSEKCRGLAASYNKGIRLATGKLIVTLHQDIILSKDSLEKLILPFQNETVVAAGHTVAHPVEVWNGYNFWQKCFFARLVEKEFSGIDGKFDCFRRESLEKAGLFDEVNFQSAGEDGDMVFKLKKIGRVADTDAKIIHVHRADKSFGIRDIIYKQKQYSEAQGALFVRGRIERGADFSRAFFRELLVVALFVPYIRIVSVCAIAAYSILYTKKVFSYGYRNKRIFILPFLNIYLLLVSFIYSLRGMIYKKQRI